MRVTATDADDESYGNSAKLVYSILQGQPYFSVEPETGKYTIDLDVEMYVVNLCYHNCNNFARSILLLTFLQYSKCTDLSFPNRITSNTLA